jgi:hypothetical protein
MGDPEQVDFSTIWTRNSLILRGLLELELTEFDHKGCYFNPEIYYRTFCTSTGICSGPALFLLAKSGPCPFGISAILNTGTRSHYLKINYLPVLRFHDVYPGSEFFHPGVSKRFRIPDTHKII